MKSGRVRACACPFLLPGPAAPGKTEVLEGEWALPRTVVMEFPAIDWARARYADPDYNALKAHRLASATANLVLVEGIGSLPAAAGSSSFAVRWQ